MEFFCEPGGDGLTDDLIGRDGVGGMMFRNGQWLFFHAIISFSYMIEGQKNFYDKKMDEIEHPNKR